MEPATFTSTTTQEESGMKLTEVSFERIRTAGMTELYDLAVIAGIQGDEHLVHSEDLRQRLILMKRKMEGSSNTWKHLFQSVKDETKVKSQSLVELMKTVEATFKMCPVDSLSEILRKEGHLQNRDLLQEISKRMKKLIEGRSLVIIAGETNGGKSTFLNLLLGEDILPTDVLHCTFAVCKIVYSDSYSVKTLDYNDQVEHFPCASRQEVKAILNNKMAQQEVRERVNGSPIKEITLGLPAEILKSGVTLVDTPGIGEDENMDNVTINFVKSTHASAFIYIIKSDTSGGVQEDRLLGFLRAIKERYSADSEVEAFDPRAAMFVCHRWDNIEEHHRESVKKNALSKLEYVWPGFEPSQTFFFSTTDTKKHLPVDPEFVTDSYMMLLKGLKNLFDRACQNAIKHQYLWLKYLLQPASRHLRSMITHCIHNNEELEVYFKSVAVKQNRLMLSSIENSERLQNELNALSMDLKEKIVDDLNLDNISIHNEIHDCDEIILACSKEDFLYSKANRRQLDEMIIRCLLKYVDDHVHTRKIVVEMESKILTAIQDHLGLFKSQIHGIKHAMQHGGNISLTPSPSRTNLDVDDLSSQFGASTMSMNSTDSNGSSVESFRNEMTFDTSQLALTVKSLLLKRKEGKSRSNNNSKHEFQESLLSKVKSKIKHGFLHKAEPAVYVEERIRKVAKDIREDADIMDSIVLGYTEWIQQCVNYATNSIPRFIEVNNKLMDEIREHRSNFQRDKDLLRKVMENLEPSRHHMRGYGMLYMDDINAETLAFNVEQRNSSVFVPRDLVAEHKLNDDSGFQGSGSKNRKVRSLWARMKGATIMINNEAERVVIKTYIYDMDEKAVLSEIASLRCLDFTNLASFLGMTRIEASGSTRGSTGGTENLTEKLSAFIFKGDLISARVFSTRKMTNMQLFVPDLIHSLLQGLNYIHREGLVHMELNLDTVMVERVTGTVKLCQMCKPREARFPASLSTITQSCVCLSPNVLQGHEYESTDDMYAFGLILWELLFPNEPPYKAQRMWPLKKFIEECHPTNMLQDSLKQLNVSEHVREVLKGTLLVSRRNICMPIATVQSLMVDIYHEPAVRRLRSRQEAVVYRRMSPAYQSALDLIITNASGTLTKLPTGSLRTDPSPERPPRKTDKLKLSVSEEEPEIKDLTKLFPSNNKRRQSEPTISAYHLSSSTGKSKGKFGILIDVLFGRGSTKGQSDEELEKSDDFARYIKYTSRRRLSLIPDETDNKLQQSKDIGYSSPQLQPKLNSKNANKEASVHSKPYPRHLSLQDQSLFGPKRVNLKRDDSFDVPSLMSKKFPVNLNNTLSKDDASRANDVSNSTLNLSDEELEKSDEFASDIKSTSRRRLSLIPDKTDNKLQQSKDIGYSSPQLQPKLNSKNANKEASVHSKPYPRRLSLQDQSLFGPKRVNLKRDDSFDVPSLMSKKFPVNLNNTLSKDDASRANDVSNSPLNLYLNGRTPSHLISDGSTKSTGTEFYRKQRIMTYMANSSKSRSGTHKSLLSDSKAAIYSVPEEVSKRLSQGLGRSLQDISGSSLNSVSHPVSPIKEGKDKTAGFQNGHDRLGHRLGISLQDVSSVNHAIGPIMEDTVDTAGLQNGHARYVSGVHHINRSLKKNNGYHTLPPPAIYNQAEKSSQPASYTDENIFTFEGSSGSSSSLAFSSSASSLSSDSPTVLVFSNIGIYNKYNDRSYLPIDHKRSHSEPVNTFRDNAFSLDTDSGVTVAFNNSASDARIVYRGECSERTVSNGDTLSELASEKYVQNSSLSNVQIIPAPPPINFSKLSFGQDDDDDDDDDDDEG